MADVLERDAVARPKWDAHEHLLAERREAEATVPHAAIDCLSAAYAVCKTSRGFGGLPQEKECS